MVRVPQFIPLTGISVIRLSNKDGLDPGLRQGVIGVHDQPTFLYAQLKTNFLGESANLTSVDEEIRTI
jgi:hypothetical protein